MARKNIPPIREPVFDAFIELPPKVRGQPPIRLPMRFRQTTREWAEYFNNLSNQSATAADDLGIEALFGDTGRHPESRAQPELNVFDSLPGGGTATPARASFLRHFLLMGG